MTKIRKQKRQKRFRYANPRRARKKNQIPIPNIQSKTVRNVWNKKKSTLKNIRAMGLVYDVNAQIKEGKNSSMEVAEQSKPQLFVNTEVIEKLEEEANAPRVKSYRLPKNQVQYITYLMDTYGEDYKAMTRDKRNHAQATWKQLRRKINVFKSIPEQYNEYLNSKMET